MGPLSDMLGSVVHDVEIWSHRLIRFVSCLDYLHSVPIVTCIAYSSHLNLEFLSHGRCRRVAETTLRYMLAR